jgi:Domain of unknown function (DUF4157)
VLERLHEHEPEAAEAEAERVWETEDGIKELANNVGNASFSAFAREGAGIMPDGTAHPQVEATIAQTRAGGATLPDGVRERVEEGLAESLPDVRVHTDATADALARSVAARAFTTGSDIYFAKDEYRPGNAEGDRLITHELAHVVQQRGAPAVGPLRVSEPGEPLEAEADAVTHELGW